MALDEMNFNITTNLSSDYLSKIEGAIASYPTQISLLIYEVDEAFLFTTTPSINYMLSHPKTVNIHKNPSKFTLP